MKAHSKSEMKRLYAMGIEDVEAHLDWCAIDEMGVCSCQSRAQHLANGCKTPATCDAMNKPPASEASGPNRGTATEVLARQHLEALGLLRKADLAIRHARRLLGDKGA